MKYTHWILLLGVAACFTAILSKTLSEKQASSQPNLLIIGCARSGTTYITKVLKKCGLRIGHEKIKQDGVCSWEMVVDTPTVPWGEARNGKTFKHTFHQVRHPLSTISSVYYSEPERIWDFISLHIPEIKKEDSKLTKCAKYWYYWNLKAEAQAEWSYPIENIESHWPEFSNRLGKYLNTTRLKKVPKNSNTRKTHPQFTWKDLEDTLDPDLYLKICSLSQHYGYILLPFESCSFGGAKALQIDDRKEGLY